MLILKLDVLVDVLAAPRNVALGYIMLPLCNVTHERVPWFLVFVSL